MSCYELKQMLYVECSLYHRHFTKRERLSDIPENAMSSSVSFLFAPVVCPEQSTHGNVIGREPETTGQTAEGWLSRIIPLTLYLECSTANITHSTGKIRNTHSNRCLQRTGLVRTSLHVRDHL